MGPEGVVLSLPASELPLEPVWADAIVGDIKNASTAVNEIAAATYLHLQISEVELDISLNELKRLLIQLPLGPSEEISSSVCPSAADSIHSELDSRSDEVSLLFVFTAAQLAIP